MPNSSHETVEIGKKVLHALNNSGYVSLSDPHRAIIETVLLDLRLMHGITPDTPPGDPDIEIPLIVRLIGKYCGDARRPSFDPVANQSYNLWSSVCFIAWISSFFSGVFILIGFWGMLFFGERNWAMIGAFVLMLCGSLFLKRMATLRLFFIRKIHELG